MGFDYECIVDIQSLAGEYFCPVCRQLVYPDEALRSQCSHLYCKPCLTYIVTTTQACPYDGFLVTEADTKLLSEADKTLAETIGKIPVHCLYHRSGCQWQGPLSECSSHCSGCAFGNSPVVCNRCGMQIVHRQVQEHVQNCPGVQSQVQQVEGVHDAAAISTSANQTQTTNLPAASTTQAQAPQPAAVPPNQDANQQVTATSTAVATPGQWYQQQYQHYYQQYPGYDPYQQQYQYYYPYQQPIQQYQQHPSNVHGQPQPQAHAQLQPQAQAQLQVQTQTQSQIQPHPPSQPLQYAQAIVAVQNQNQAAVNAQHHLYPAGQPPVQMQLQVQGTPYGHHHPQPQTQSHAQAQLHPQPLPVQPRPQQQPMQVPQYQQPHSQIQHPPAQIQQQPHSHGQPQQPLPQQPQTHPQTQLQQPHSHPQTQPPFQVSQSQNPNPPPQSHHPPVHAVTGHQSYPQPQVHQQQLEPQHMNPQNGPLPQHPPHQVHGQFPQQPPQMRPMQPNAPLANQQPPVLLPAQGPATSFTLAQQHPVYPHGQQPGYPGHQRPVMQPTQQSLPQQSVQPHQTFQGQTPGPLPNQLHPSGPFVQQQPPPSMLSQSHPLGPSHSLPQSVHHLPSQQSITPQNIPLQQSQSYSARPIVPSHGAQSQPLPQSPTVFAGPAQVRPMQPVVNQASVGQSDTLRRDNQLQMSSEQQITQPAMSSESAILLRQGGKKLSEQQNGPPSQSIAKKEPGDLIPNSGYGVDSAVVKASKSESQLVSTDGGQKPNEDFDADANVNVKGIDFERAIKHVVKKEGDESVIGHSVGGVTIEALAEGKTDAANFHHQEKYSSVGGALLAGSLEERNGKPVDSEVACKGSDKGAQAGVQNQSHLGPQGPGVEEVRGFHIHSDAQGKSFTNPAEQVPLTDHSRYPNMPLQFSPSIQHQRHAGGSLYPPTLPPGAPHPLQSQNIPRPQGPGQLPQPGQNLVPPEHILAGPPERSFDPSVAPQGDYRHHHMPPPHGGLPRILQNEPPASFNASVTAMRRALPRGPGGQIGQPNPINPMETELFHNQRSSCLNGRQPALHPFGTLDGGPFGEPASVESNVVRMNRAQGGDPSLAVGLRDERFKSTTEDGLNCFPVEPARHHDQVFKHPYNCDASNDVRDRARPLGRDGNIGRMDSVHSCPDFLGTAPDFVRHHMDRMALRSPGREYPDFPSRDFGGVSRLPHNQPGLDDISRWESRPFSDASRGLNFPTDPAGNSFSQSRFPVLPAHLQRDAVVGPGNLRGGDMTRPDILPPHLMKGDLLGPRNFPSHLPLGEPGFGRPHMGDLVGPGNVAHHPPRGEPFGGNRFGYPRIGEPGFRSSYSLAGGMDPFDRRKPPGMVLCRICKIDCETVEGLELHSQTREHQKMAMGMVLNIKQNAKKRKTSNNLSALEEPSKLRGSGFEVRGNKR